MAKDIPVSTVISQHHHLTLLTSKYVIVDFEMAVPTLILSVENSWETRKSNFSRL